MPCEGRQLETARAADFKVITSQHHLWTPLHDDPNPSSPTQHTPSSASYFCCFRHIIKSFLKKLGDFDART
jgi:hypothetical protein